MIDATELSQGDPKKLDADEKDSVDAVLEEYGNLEPYYLRALTHEESPWRDARGNLPEDANSDERITVESMGKYYGELIYGQNA